jgi:outer membrane protein OmpA-like peptidoglycan-associated protein
VYRFGNPFRQVLNFDFYDEHAKLVSHNAIVSEGSLERTNMVADFGHRQRIRLAVIPQKGLIRLGGYYEIEVTGAAAFDGAASELSDVRPVDTSLYHSVESLSKSGVSLYNPGQALVVSRIDKETRIVIAADVLFDFDRAIIRPDAVSALKQAASLLREPHRGPIRIEGHTDAKGSSAYNLRLSNERAIAVEAWLVQTERFDVATFRTQGFGAGCPVAPNTKRDGSDDPEGRQRNRRVELIMDK